MLRVASPSRGLLGGALAAGLGGVLAVQEGSASPPAAAGRGGHAGAVPREPGGLVAMLARVPAQPPLLEAPRGAWLMYADVAAQLAAVGVAVPDGGDAAAITRWLQAVRWLTLPQSMGLSWTESRFGWREMFGFDAYQVDQTFAIEAPPFGLTLLRGRFDPAEVRAALARTGYAPRDVDGTTIASLGEEPDLTAMAVRLTLGQMNNAAILADGTLVFTHWVETMRAVLAVERGQAAAMTRRVDVATLLPTHWPDLVSAALVPGIQLIGQALDVGAVLGTPNPDVDALATQIATAAAELQGMPPVVTALLGTTAGGPLASLSAEATSEPLLPGQAAARMVVALVMTSPDAARQAVPVVTARLGTGATRDGQTYATLFPVHTVRAVAGAPVVLIELDPAAETPRDILIRLLILRDLGLLACRCNHPALVAIRRPMSWRIRMIRQS